jgi:hypothetical protein
MIPCPGSERLRSSIGSANRPCVSKGEVLVCVHRRRTYLQTETVSYISDTAKGGWGLNLRCRSIIVFQKITTPLIIHYLNKKSSEKIQDSVTSNNIQPNKMHCIVFRYSILQYFVNQSNMFRALMGSIIRDSCQSNISRN